MTAREPGATLRSMREEAYGRSRPVSAFDVVLAIGLAALLTVGTYLASRDQTDPGRFDVGAVLLVVLAAGALAFRHRYPVPVLLTVFGTIVTYFVVGYPPGPIWIALIVAYFTAVLHGHRLVAVVVAVVGFLVFPHLDFLLRDEPPPSFLGLAALGAWLLVLLGAAEAVRMRRERVAEAFRMREEERRRRATEERLRIARELHDALGHHLSLINVQSGVALHLGEGLPDPVRESLSAIKEASKEGLAELRSVLDILRQEGERAPRSPTSTLSRLDDLVSQASAAGLEVRTRTEGEPRPLPFGVEVAAFRIVQEALTNVTRHSGATAASVLVSYGDRDLTVQVEDQGRGPDPARGNGRGILGMRERVEALGGELEAGARPGGGFRVRARLPLRDLR
jgi:signal transduction histidine kinase